MDDTNTGRKRRTDNNNEQPLLRHEMHTVRYRIIHSKPSFAVEECAFYHDWGSVHSFMLIINRRL